MPTRLRSTLSVVPAPLSSRSPGLRVSPACARNHDTGAGDGWTRAGCIAGHADPAGTGITQLGRAPDSAASRPRALRSRARRPARASLAGERHAARRPAGSGNAALRPGRAAVSGSPSGQASGDGDRQHDFPVGEVGVPQAQAGHDHGGPHHRPQGKPKRGRSQSRRRANQAPAAQAAAVTSRAVAKRCGKEVAVLVPRNPAARAGSGDRAGAASASISAIPAGHNRWAVRPLTGRE